MLGRPADLAEPERAQRAFVSPALADRAPHLRDLHLAHSAVTSPFSSAAGSSTAAAGAFAAGSASAARAAETGSTSLIERPRSRATSSGRRSRLSPTTVALAMLIGFVVPRLFAS